MTGKTCGVNALQNISINDLYREIADSLIYDPIHHTDRARYLRIMQLNNRNYYELVEYTRTKHDEWGGKILYDYTGEVVVKKYET